MIPPVLAAWLAAALALEADPTSVTICCAGALATAAVLLGVTWRLGRRAGTLSQTGAARARRRAGSATAVVIALLCATATAAVAALHAADSHRGLIPKLAQEHAEAEVDLTVTGDPRLIRPRVRGPVSTPPALAIDAVANRVRATEHTPTHRAGSSPLQRVVRTRTPVLLIVDLRGTARAGEASAAYDEAEATGGGRSDPGGSRRSDPGGLRGSGEPSTTADARWRELLPSTRLRVRVRVVPPTRDGDRVGAVLRTDDERPPLVLAGPGDLQRTAGRLRAGLRAASDGLSADARALLPGLVVGDTSRVPPDLDEAFRATDMTHLLAVSGSNLSIVLALLIGPPHMAARAERRGLAARLGVPLRLTALLGGVLTLGFVVVCRPEPSVLRAAACGLITLIAIGTGRRRTLLPALAAAVLALLLYDPWLARSYGFLLSVLATGALLTIAPRWSAALRARGVPGRLAEVLAAAAAAQAVCAPVVVVLAARVSLVAIPCNLLAELAIAPATVLGFAALAVGPLAPPVAVGLAWCAGWPVEWLASVARTGAGLPGSGVSWPGSWGGALLLAGVTVVVVLLARRALGHPWLCVVCALLLMVAVVRPAPLVRVITGWPPPDWRMVACDVGQGDALVLAAGEGTAVVVDAGPDQGAVDRCLRDLGIVRVPLVVLTHFHADHVAGLPGVLRGRAVGAVETTSLREPPGQAAFVRRAVSKAGVKHLEAVPGERRRTSGLSWQVLWPPRVAPGSAAPTGVPDTAHPGGAPTLPGGAGAADVSAVTGANDASVTLLVRTAGLTLLLLGDLEPTAQRALLAAHPNLGPVDVLKVAHHGSAHQDHQLLRSLRPRLALISCGADNPYGHPAPRTVAALREQGARVLRTDVDGAVAITGAGGVPRASISGRRRGGRSSPSWSRGGAGEPATELGHSGRS
ncbi:ComEC/Rec2 family competence protein [Streptomyces sp. 71268]|uniref:ComEC/Rec2 family competence protein n=1 Tax=Streptomyces sp. 71268 TaxID=3002640 RepID=UPI0023F925CD|nr:ComEC/Rec2 family competence protein [Streptomyces sp. 71268]WEV27892.1 ComEC/Rec2 family competence protein [Streptomyces sp. 71268]